MNETSHEPVSIQYIAREVEMYSLTKSEIISLNSGDGGCELALACATGGIFISLFITVLTVPMNSAALFASFVACSLAMGLLCLYFSLQSFTAKKKTREQVNTILERSMDRPANFRVVNHPGA